MRQLETKVAYLEMTASPPPKNTLAPPRPGLSIIRAVNPTLSFYRFLYEGVGKNLMWTARILMKDEELDAILKDPLVEIHVLYTHDAPAGYVELDGRRTPEIEIAYFGLFPPFYGRGLGPYLLNWAIRTAWRKNPSRLWVHTCTLDHPKALATYLEAGFTPYRESLEYVTTL